MAAVTRRYVFRVASQAELQHELAAGVTVSVPGYVQFVDVDFDDAIVDADAVDACMRKRSAIPDPYGTNLADPPFFALIDSAGELWELVSVAGVLTMVQRT